jgi:hypothetical protein
MFIYNVTIKVMHEIQEEWLFWLTEEHIPEVLGTGCFSGHRVLRLLETDETEGVTFAVQYEAESKSLYNHYIDKHASLLREKSYHKWGDRFIAFRTVMQVVN